MAVNTRSLVVKFAADTKKLHDDVDKVSSKFKTFAAGIGVSLAAAGVAIDKGLDMQASVSKMNAQLGAMGKDGERLGRVAGQLYANAYGDSIDQVNEAISGVVRNIQGLGAVSDEELKGISADALNLATILGDDVTKVTRTVGTMLKNNLAPNAKAAFDILTAGVQHGVNVAGDLLDTFDEYSVQFQKFGYDAKTAMGLLSQGLQGGARDADVIADAIKEFSIRAIDGSKLTAQGFKAIGLDASKMAADIAKGGPVAAAALDLTLDRLRAMKDPVQRDAAAVALFGTKAEDMGKALYSLDPSTAVQSLGDVTGAAQRMGDTLSDNAKNRFTAFKRQLETDLIASLQGVIPVIEKLAPAIGDFIAGTLAKFAQLVKFLVDNSGWLVPLVAGFYGLVKVVGITTAAIDLLNVAMYANPAILIVGGIMALVAAIGLLWANSAGFRQFFIDMWHAIADAANWAWNNVIKPVVDALVTAWGAISDAVRAAYSSVIKPTIDAIGAAANWLWSNVIQPVVDAISAAWTGLQPVFDFVGSAIGLVFTVIAGAAQILWSILSTIFEFIKIGFQIVGAVLQAVWTIAIQPIFMLIGLGFQALGDIFAWVWDNVIKRIWDAISFAVELLWTGFLQPIFDAIGWAFRTMGDAIAWTYHKVIAPVLGFFSDLFQGIGKVVDGVVSFIKDAWSVISKIFGTPVKWVVDVIWNNGIVAFWNWLAGLIGLGKLDTIDTSGWPHFASGGPVRGPGGPTDDSIVARLSNGEYVMPADKTREYFPVLEAMRSGYALPGFSEGGLVGPILDVIDWVGGAIGDAIEFIKDPIGHVKRAIGDNAWIGMVAKTPWKLITSMGQFLWDKIKAFVSEKPVGDLSQSEMESKYHDILTAAVRFTGVGDDWIGPLAVLIRRESGWNPNAINLTDSNAQRGTPSKGLMQTIDPTFQRYRDQRLPNNPFDPLANIVAGINYIKSRYGTIFSVQQANPNMPAKGYDNGGWLPPGYSTVYNGTGQPERVLSPQQSADLGTVHKHYHLTVVTQSTNIREDFRRMEQLDAAGIL